MTERDRITDEDSSGSVHTDYQAPEISVLGSFEELTQGAAGNVSDGLEFQTGGS